jgi:hypothetical protein
VHWRLQGLQDLRALLELVASPGLRKIAAEDDEVGLRVERVDIVDRLQRRAHEAIIDVAHVHMCVGDVGKGEGGLARALRLRHLDDLKPVRRYQPFRSGDSSRRARYPHEAAA